MEAAAVRARILDLEFDLAAVTRYRISIKTYV